MENRNDLLTKQQLADALSVSVAEVSAMVRAREVPPFNVQIGKDRFWTPNFVSQYANPSLNIHLETQAIPKITEAADNLNAPNTTTALPEVSNKNEDAKFRCFGQAIKEVNLSGESQTLLNEIIKIGSGSMMTYKILQDRLKWFPDKLCRAKKELEQLEIITCTPIYRENRKKGTCITVNYDFYLPKPSQDTISQKTVSSDNKFLSLLTEIANAKPKFSLGARGLLSHYLTICASYQTDIVSTTEKKICPQIGISDPKCYRKYKNELIARGVITFESHALQDSDIKIDFEWSSKKPIIKTSNTKFEKTTGYEFLTISDIARLCKVCEATVTNWIKHKQFPDCDINLNGRKRWNKKTVYQFLKFSLQ